MGEVSESTEALLDAFRDDLQLQLRRSAVVESMTLEEADEKRVTLTATVRVAAQEIELTGSGETVVAAYGDLLTGAGAEVVLASAYRQVLEHALRT